MMLRWTRIQVPLTQWDHLLQPYPERTLFQSANWLHFLLQTVRGGELVQAVLRGGNSEVGYFAGIVITKLGLRILGSPLPGWTTSYMGFVLQPDISRIEALDALRQFAFEDLKCVHLELMDRKVEATGLNPRYGLRSYNGFEIDLSRTEEDILSKMAPACRRNLKKATRCGVRVEEAHDPEFAGDYYAQLQDVFAKQGLSPTYSVDRVEALIHHLQASGNLLLLRAVDDKGHCIATGIFPAMHDRAYFWGGASWREHQHLRPNELLFWYAMRYWKARGIRYLDMGGSGEYKRKYGGQEISVPWLRTSRYPILPFLRHGAMVMAKTRQRWHAALHLGAAAGVRG
jgi:hypothetical protein